jgi:hypothetical protein
MKVEWGGGVRPRKPVQWVEVPWLNNMGWWVDERVVVGWRGGGGVRGGMGGGVGWRATTTITQTHPYVAAHKTHATPLRCRTHTNLHQRWWRVCQPHGMVHALQDTIPQEALARGGHHGHGKEVAACGQLHSTRGRMQTHAGQH